MDQMKIKSATELTQVIQTHHAWKRRIQAVSEKTSDEKFSAETLAKDDECALGKWIHGQGKSAFSEMPAFSRLLQDHATFHRLAADALTLALAGKSAEAKAALGGDMASASTKTINALTEIYQEAKKSS